jgi:hypothetical protein
MWGELMTIKYAATNLLTPSYLGQPISLVLCSEKIPPPSKQDKVIYTDSMSLLPYYQLCLGDIAQVFFTYQ